MGIKYHSFTSLSGAISETIVPSLGSRSELRSLNLKFSDVITQDTVFIQRLDTSDNVRAQFGFAPADESATATAFTWVPPGGALELDPGEKIKVTFANNDGRALTADETNAAFKVY